MTESADERNFAASDVIPPVLYACNFSCWKRPIVRSLFSSSRVVFIHDASRVPAGATLVAWGRRPLPGALREGVSVLRLEDGFLRSAGLGADLVRPLSWVVDRKGIYYDATQASDLEDILMTTDFTPALCMRAADLRNLITSRGITKYNVGASVWRRPGNERRVVLVPGQVESDASLRYGNSEVRSNLALVRSVRKANPDAYVIYKPHPDVTAGLRAPGAGEDDAAGWCNEVVGDVAMGSLLLEVDEVHVMTSLAGFEGLLRGKSVVCYGQPFYAGWGLTTDYCPVARRTRPLSLDELVAGVLILYPRYVSRKTGKLIEPEQALAELIDWCEQTGGSTPWWRTIWRPLLRRITGVR